MLFANTSINKRAVQYAEAISGTIELICNPLFSNFDITNFGYVKFYDDGTMVRFSTNYEWTKKYFEHGFYNDIDFYTLENIPEGGMKKNVIYGNPLGSHYSALYDHNIWNIIVIYERQKGFGNVWFFASTKEKTQIIDFYLNNIGILEHFILYFKEKAYSIINDKKEEKIIYTKINPFAPTVTKNNCEELFLDKIKSDKFYLEGKYQGIYFTRREFFCLLHLSRGKTQKEISILLNISSKTVESYINSMKFKMNGLSTTKLIELFQENWSF